MFFRKDKKIEKLESIIRRQQKLIEDEESLIKIMRRLIDSILEDNRSLLEVAYKSAKKRTSRSTKSN